MSKNDVRPITRRQTTTNAILDAAEALFSERGFSAVTVREIGQEAGVTHALVHRYLGAKDEIFRAVLRRNEDSIRHMALETDDLSVALSRMIREILEHRRSYVRLIANSSSTGIPFDSSIVRFPATELLLELAEKRVSGAARGTDLPPDLVVATIVALFVGWIAMEPWLLPAIGLQDLDDETIAAALESVILGIVAQQLPGGDD